MTRRNRLIALLLAMTVFLAMLFSACFVIAEANHECIGEDCPICCQIAACEITLRCFGAAAAAVIIAVFSGLSVVALLTSAKSTAYNTSLVSLKVKLSN